MQTPRIFPLQPTDFIGNRPASVLDLQGGDRKTLRDKYLIGEPRACAAGTAEEMKRRGFVGIYRKAAPSVFRVPGTDLIIRVNQSASWRPTGNSAPRSPRIRSVSEGLAADNA